MVMAVLKNFNYYFIFCGFKLVYMRVSGVWVCVNVL